jgi:hypothetical protein
MARMVIQGLRIIELNQACSLTDSTVTECGTLDATKAGTTNGADLSGSRILESAVAANTSAVIWNVNADPDGELDDMTFSIGAAAHHAIEFGTSSPLTMTLRNWAVTGFNASDAQNDSTFHIKRTSGTVTINVLSSTGNYSYRTDGATVVVNVNQVTTLINVKDNDGVNLQNARVLVEAANDSSDLPFENTVTITRSGTVATVSHTGHGLNTSDRVKIKGITDKTEDNNGTHAVATVANPNSYTYTTTDSGSTNYTGTIKATGVLIDGLTDASGNISRDRTFLDASGQAITGRVRKSTSSPRFKTADLSGTVNKDNGITLNIQLILDE